MIEGHCDSACIRAEPCFWGFVEVVRMGKGLDYRGEKFRWEGIVPLVEALVYIGAYLVLVWVLILLLLMMMLILVSTDFHG